MKRSRNPGSGKGRVLMAASVASMIDQFNLPNIRLLQGMGYEVHVACNFKEGNTCDEKRLRALKKKLRDLHVIPHQWDCPRSIVSVRGCCRAYVQLSKLAARIRFDWMHCHSPVGGALARMAAHRYAVPVMYTAHGFHFYKGAPLRNWLLYYPAEKLLACWTDVLVTVNREDYGLAKRRLRAGRVYRIPGVGVDPACIRVSGRKKDPAALRRKYGIPDKALLLLSVGELSRRKNHEVVLRALALLAAEDPAGREDVCYLVCGQGVLEKKLARQADRYGVGGQVRLAGFVEDVAPVYRAADIFVFPSYQEGMPVALMEAMAAGMPCVVSDIRGNRELIGQKELRFAPDSPGQLAERLAGLIRCKQERREAYGARNREKIRAYSLEEVQKRMTCIYAEFRDGTAVRRQKGVLPCRSRHRPGTRGMDFISGFFC